MKFLVPLTLSNVYADLISYQLQNAAPEIASLFLSDGDFAAQLFDHGCWCAKIGNPISFTNLGGNQPVDDLDQICKDWARARRCSRAAGASCEYADFTSIYEIEVSPQRCIDSETCLSETCQIDYHFIEAINTWRSANPVFSPVTNPDCPTNTQAHPNSCESFATTILPETVNETDQEQLIDDLADVGVDNSDKQITVSLIWDAFCDLDLHVFEPSGFEIYYANSTSPNTGSLDVDNTSGPYPAIENISWLTAPVGTYRVAVKNFGRCSPDIPFKLYIQIDGVISLYETTAPAGDNTKYEIVSFDWSSTSRSSAVDIDTYQVAIADDNAPEKNQT